MKGEFEPVFVDSNVQYGGVWIKDHGDYGEVVELTDLDGATGTRGMVMLERGTVGLYASTFAENLNRLRNAFQGGISLKGVNHESGRLIGWYHLWSYGYGDREGPPQIIRTDPEAKLKQDGWQAEITVQDKDLRGYLRSMHGLKMPEDQS